ncbi:MAG TPA: D-2-hydroxyacid dehydrogenase family protein [Methylomirabilota bacterium]|jgi:phosphoglycerate dehydrogenase-like enzyme|nr:D-2-hydroxyacid dehydrogenase family protein [Methylomirabilota bacterium]
MTRLAITDDWGGMVRPLAPWTRLSGRATIDAFQDTLADESALAQRLAPYDIIVAVRERTRFTAGLINRLPALKLLALAGRWTGQVDLTAAAARGIVVTETEGSAVNAFEHTVALMMALVRRVPQEDRAMRAGKWQTPPLGVDMAGKTLGIIGLGKIGGKMAAFGRLLGMRVLATGITLTDERAAAAGVTRTDLETLLRESDVVSVHLRLSDTSRGLITARHLALMKRTAFLVNTARGPIVDEAALLDALRGRRIAGAALDVFDVEPLPAGHPLLALDNVVLTPHLGFVTAEGYAVFFGQAVEAILAFLDGKTPPRVVAPR